MEFDTEMLDDNSLIIRLITDDNKVHYGYEKIVYYLNIDLELFEKVIINT